MQTVARHRRVCWGFEVGCTYGQEQKEGRVQSESFKIKTKQRPALKISQADKPSPVIQTKLNSAYFARPTLRGSLLVHASGNQKQTFPRLIWGKTPDKSLALTKIPIWSIVYKSDVYRKPVSQSSSFVFLRAHSWDFPFYILRFHFILKFFGPTTVVFSFDHALVSKLVSAFLPLLIYNRASTWLSNLTHNKIQNCALTWKTCLIWPLPDSSNLPPFVFF